MEEMMHSASADVIELMLKVDGKPFNPLMYTTLLIYNTIGTMAFSRTWVSFNFFRHLYIMFNMKEPVKTLG